MLTSPISIHALQVRLRALPMICRTRFLIMPVLLCHWFVATPLVTSQLRAQVNPDAPSALDRENVTIRSQEQEVNGNSYKLRGQVQIQYGPYTLYGDEMTYNRDTGEAVADGHVVLDGSSNNEHLQATHGVYNTRAQTGRASCRERV